MNMSIPADSTVISLTPLISYTTFVNQNVYFSAMSLKGTYLIHNELIGNSRTSKYNVAVSFSSSSEDSSIYLFSPIQFSRSDSPAVQLLQILKNKFSKEIKVLQTFENIQNNQFSFLFKTMQEDMLIFQVQQIMYGAQIGSQFDILWEMPKASYSSCIREEGSKMMYCQPTLRNSEVIAVALQSGNIKWSNPLIQGAKMTLMNQMLFSTNGGKSSLTDATSGVIQKIYPSSGISLINYQGISTFFARKNLIAGIGWETTDTGDNYYLGVAQIY